MSPDGLLYTFKLKKNVLFHDGTRLDAAAVKFSIDRLMDPATRSGMRSFYESVHCVEVLDPPACRSGSSIPMPSCCTCWPPIGWAGALLAGGHAEVQLEDRKEGKPEAILGCGPFKLVEWVKGSHLVMDRFDKYFVPGLPSRPRGHPGDQGPGHADGRVQGRRDRLHRRLLSRSRRHAAGPESSRPDHDRQGNDADGRDDEGHRAGDGKPMSKERGPPRSSTTSGSARRSAATASTARRS